MMDWFAAEARRIAGDVLHRHGSRYVSLDAMLKDQLGEGINPKYFVVDYLTKKYTELYKL